MSNNGKFMNIGGDGAPTVETGASAGGAPDANKIPKLDAGGRLPFAMMPAGVNNEAGTATASEAIAAGALINLYNASGALAMRNADNTTAGKEAHGFVLAAVANAAQGTYFLPGSIDTSVSSRTIGARQFLGAGGAMTEAVPTASGSVVQIVGVATGATSVVFNPQAPVTIS